MEQKGPLPILNKKPKTPLGNTIVQSIFKFSKSIFNCNKIIRLITAAFPTIMCEVDNCFQIADLLEINRFKCNEHQEEFSEKNMKINEVLQMYNDIIKEIEQQYVKVEIIFSFMKSEGVISEIDVEDVQKMNTLYEKIKYELSIVESKAENMNRD